MKFDKERLARWGNRSGKAGGIFGMLLGALAVFNPDMGNALGGVLAMFCSGFAGYGR